MKELKLAQRRMIYNKQTGKEEWPGLDYFFPALLYPYGAENYSGNTPSHWHECVEVLLAVDGNPVVWTEDQQHILNKNDIVFLNAGLHHHVTFQKGSNDKIIVVAFKPDLIYDNHTRPYEIEYFDEFFCRNTYHYIPVMPKLTDKLVILLEKALKEYQAQRYGYELEVVSCLAQIVAQTLRFYHEREKTQEDRQQDGRLKIAMQYIHTHYYEKISLEQLAEMCSYNYSYFSKLFKRVNHVSVSEYIHDIRMREAKK